MVRNVRLNSARIKRDRPLLATPPFLCLRAIATKIALGLALAAAILQVPPLAFAQPKEPGGRRIVTTTRLVSKFSDLEEQLTRAIQHKDEARLSKLVSEDFEQWTPAPPGDPVPREEWMHNVLTASTLQSFQIRQMAVHTAGDTAVVSFVQTERAICTGRDCSGSSFVVDLWQQDKDAAQLLVRYESKLSGPTALAPDSPKPTGKE